MSCVKKKKFTGKDIQKVENDRNFADFLQGIFSTPTNISSSQRASRESNTSSASPGRCKSPTSKTTSAKVKTASETSLNFNNSFSPARKDQLNIAKLPEINGASRIDASSDKKTITNIPMNPENYGNLNKSEIMFPQKGKKAFSRSPHSTQLYNETTDILAEDITPVFSDHDEVGPSVSRTNHVYIETSNSNQTAKQKFIQNEIPPDHPINNQDVQCSHEFRQYTGKSVVISASNVDDRKKYIEPVYHTNGRLGKRNPKSPESKSIFVNDCGNLHSQTGKKLEVQITTSKYDGRQFYLSDHGKNIITIPKHEQETENKVSTDNRQKPDDNISENRPIVAENNVPVKFIKNGCLAVSEKSKFAQHTTDFEDDVAFSDISHDWPIGQTNMQNEENSGLDHRDNLSFTEMGDILVTYELSLSPTSFQDDTNSHSKMVGDFGNQRIYQTHVTKEKYSQQKEVLERKDNSQSSGYETMIASKKEIVNVKHNYDHGRSKSRCKTESEELCSFETDERSMDGEEKRLEQRLVEISRKNDRLQSLERKLLLKERIREKEKKQKMFIERILRLQPGLHEIIEKDEDCLLYERPDVETKADFVEKHNNLLPQGMRKSLYDILIIYSDEDLEKIELFRKHLRDDFKLRNGGSILAVLYNGPELESTGNNITRFAHLADSFDRCILKFIFLTNNFLSNDWAQICSESILNEAMHNEDHKWSIIPIRNSPDVKAPFGLNCLSGFDCFRKDALYHDRMCKMLNECIEKRREKEKSLIEKDYETVRQKLDETNVKTNENM